MAKTNKEHVFEEIPTGKVGWKSPSNIALVKYWGKKSGQIPSNASLSFTLSESLTETIMEYSPKKNEDFDLEFFLDNVSNDAFAEKIKTYLENISANFPFIKQLDFKIYSKNTFPHSAGIASSASGMGALALCICDIEKQYFDEYASEGKFFKRASYFARLGSGSACRSIYGGLVSWGEIDGIRNSSNMFGSQLDKDIDSIFENYLDTILIVDAGQKKVSSSFGHSLMKTNPFAKGRLEQAKKHIKILINALKSGNLTNFISVVESEALTLHSMMMTSSPYFLLMKPNTIKIIEEIWDFRNETNIPLCFTLDAGPNVHILYPEKNKQEVRDLIDKKLLAHTADQMLIHDKTGLGPAKIEL